MKRHLRFGTAPAAFLLLLTACGSGPDYYLLPNQGQPAARALAPSRSVVVSDIDLPAYAEAIEIAAIQDTGALKLDRSANWADEPRRALTQHLAGALALRLGSTVGTDPWPAFADEPAYRVEISTDRFIGSRSGAVEFSGQYFILRSADGSMTGSERFRITIPVQGETMNAFVDAHARAIEILADQIAAGISGRAYRAP